MRVHSIRNKKTNEIIYKERSLGTDSEIPYFLLPHKEDDETVQKITDKLEQEQRECTNQPLQISVFGRTVTAHCEIKHTQLDRSLIKKPLSKIIFQLPRLSVHTYVGPSVRNP